MTAPGRSANIFGVDSCRVALPKSSGIRFDSIQQARNRDIDDLKGKR